MKLQSKRDAACKALERVVAITGAVAVAICAIASVRAEGGVAEWAWLGALAACASVLILAVILHETGGRNGD